MTLLLDRITVGTDGPRGSGRTLTARLENGCSGMTIATEEEACELAEVLAGVRKPRRGRVFLDDRPVLSSPQLRAHIGLLLPKGYEPPMLARTAREHLAAARAKREKAGAPCGDLVGLLTSEELEAPAGRLSFHARRLVALEVALMLRAPSALVLCEPLRDLHPEHAQRVLATIRGFEAERTCTLILAPQRALIERLTSHVLFSDAPTAPKEKALFLRVERPRDVAVQVQAHACVWGTYLDPERPGVLIVSGPDEQQLAEACVEVIVRVRCNLTEMTPLKTRPEIEQCTKALTQTNARLPAASSPDKDRPATAGPNPQ